MHVYISMLNNLFYYLGSSYKIYDMKFNNYLPINLSDFLANKLHLTTMLSIQELSIPKMLKKQNCMLISPTGSGKTLCFVLPSLVNMHYTLPNLQVLIIVPSHELAKQICDVYSQFKELYPNLTINNTFKHRHMYDPIKAKVVVSNPLLALNLIHKGLLNVRNLQLVVFDELDMLKEFFAHELETLLTYLHQIPNLQYCLLSATLHESLRKQLTHNIPNMHFLALSNDVWNNENITHYLVELPNSFDNSNEQKLQALASLLKLIKPFFTLVFVKDALTAKHVTSYLIEHGFIDSVGFYSELKKNQRTQILLNAKKLKYHVVVCTDLAARGIDLEGVSDVINYDLPVNDLYYIHRAGRSGRATNKGNVYTFAFKDNKDTVNKLKTKVNFKMIRLSSI